VGQRHAPAALYPWERPGTHTGIRSLDRPAHSQSLYRLCYPAHSWRVPWDILCLTAVRLLPNFPAINFRNWWQNYKCTFISWSLDCCTEFIICEICSDCTRCTVHSCQIWVKVEGFLCADYLDCGHQVPTGRHVSWIRLDRWLHTSNKIFLTPVSDPSRNCVQRRGFALPRSLVLWSRLLNVMDCVIGMECDFEVGIAKKIG
jgi:hypothetical protein